MAYCLTHTQCKVIVLDVERADLLEPTAEKLAVDAGARGILVLESHEGKGRWKGMKCWKSVMESFNGDHNDVLSYGKAILPDDNATIVFTSGKFAYRLGSHRVWVIDHAWNILGTTGLPKGVLSTQRMYMSNLMNITSFSLKTKLRRGEDLALEKPAAPPKGILIPVPLFHVTGSTSMMMGGAFVGAKVVLMRKWEPKEAARLVKQENLGLIGGVPSMVLDLIEHGEDLPLETFNFGGAPAPDVLAARANRVFPNTSLAQGYGLTETNAVAAAISDEDYAARPLSCGLPCLPNDVKIVAEDKEVPTGEVGEVWLRGPNVMKGYWRDPVATDKALTKDGWLRTGDLGCVDKEGYLYIRDRIKDIIIRGGENIDTSTVENALYSDEGVLEAAVVGVPHKTLGEVVAAVVSLKPSFIGKVTEASLIKASRKILPKHAVPVIILLQADPLERTPSGKIVKGTLRQIAKVAWEKRAQTAKL